MPGAQPWPPALGRCGRLPSRTGRSGVALPPARRFCWGLHRISLKHVYVWSSAGRKRQSGARAGCPPPPAGVAGAVIGCLRQRIRGSRCSSGGRWRSAKRRRRPPRSAPRAGRGAVPRVAVRGQRGCVSAAIWSRAGNGGEGERGFTSRLRNAEIRPVRLSNTSRTVFELLPTPGKSRPRSTSPGGPVVRLD